MGLTREAEDRYVEILFYLYFKKQNPKVIGKREFWESIKGVCMVYGVEATLVTNAARMLLDRKNIPTQLEMYYLFSQKKLSSRTINAISGIYWQKQKAYAEELLFTTPPIHRVVIDLAMKTQVKEFVKSMYKFAGIFSIITEDEIF